MADNYVLFSENLGPLTPEEEKWWVDTIEAIETSDEEPPWDLVDFQWQIQDHEIWFISDENGDVDQVCELVCRFFKAHRPSDRFTMRWAETCSKSRVGQFSGGRAAVTKWGVTYLDQEQWDDFEFARHDQLKSKING